MFPILVGHLSCCFVLLQISHDFSSNSTIVSGDYCGKIEAAYGITMAQLQLWNPSLLSDCSNLILGDAYCVDGATAAAQKRAAIVVQTTLESTSATPRLRMVNRALPTGLSGLRQR